MKEVGMINGQIDSALNRQGYMDLMMAVDAGFPCPDRVELIDIALAEGVPSILDVLAELRKVHSVERIVVAQETFDHNPTYFDKVAEAFGAGTIGNLVAQAARCRGAKKVMITDLSDFRLQKASKLEWMLLVKS
jgi:D-ribose pyranose/furanose isomerase RbsD